MCSVWTSFESMYLQQHTVSFHKYNSMYYIHTLYFYNALKMWKSFLYTNIIYYICKYMHENFKENSYMNVHTYIT